MTNANHGWVVDRQDTDGSIVLPVVDIVKIMVLVIETLLVTVTLLGYGWGLLFFGHLALLSVLLVALVLLERSGLDSSELQKFILLTFAGGPIGSAAALVGSQRRWQPATNVLETWYDTIAPPERAAVTLVDQIIDNRLIRQDSRLPQRFDGLLATGSMQEKQALLAYLAAEDDQVLVSDALKLALRSSDQRVRMQAAAVAAHARARARKGMAEKLRPEPIPPSLAASKPSLGVPPLRPKASTPFQTIMRG
jgi:hypothetical protein